MTRQADNENRTYLPTFWEKVLLAFLIIMVALGIAVAVNFAIVDPIKDYFALKQQVSDMQDQIKEVQYIANSMRYFADDQCAVATVSGYDAWVPCFPLATSTDAN